MKNTIHIEVWRNDMNKKLSSFYAYWNLQHSKDVNIFPNFLHIGDWDEQFSFFVENIYDATYGTKENRKRCEDRFKN